MLILIRFILLGILILATIPIIFIVSLFRPFHASNATLYANITGPLGLKILGVDFEFLNRDELNKHHPCVFISNHQTNFDVFIVCASAPDRTVALGKKELLMIPIFGVLFWLTGNILIDRENKNKALESMKGIQFKLRHRKVSIYIMPEGTRSKGRGLLPFKKGAFHTALTAGVPIVPVVISDWLHFIDIKKWRAGKLYAKALPPIYPKMNESDALKILMSEARSSMEKGLLEVNALAGQANKKSEI